MVFFKNPALLSWLARFLGESKRANAPTRITSGAHPYEKKCDEEKGDEDGDGGDGITIVDLGCE